MINIEKKIALWNLLLLMYPKNTNCMIVEHWTSCHNNRLLLSGNTEEDLLSSFISSCAWALNKKNLVWKELKFDLKRRWRNSDQEGWLFEGDAIDASWHVFLQKKTCFYFHVYLWRKTCLSVLGGKNKTERVSLVLQFMRVTYGAPSRNTPHNYIYSESWCSGLSESYPMWPPKHPLKKSYRPFFRPKSKKFFFSNFFSIFSWWFAHGSIGLS